MNQIYSSALLLCVHLQSGNVRTDWIQALKVSALSQKNRYIWGNARTLDAAQKSRAANSRKRLPQRTVKSNGTAVISGPTSTGPDTSLIYLANGASNPLEEEDRPEKVLAEYKEDAIAYDFARKNDLWSARSHLEYILKRRPDDEFAAAELADVCVRVGSYKEALEAIGPQLSAGTSEDILLRAAVAGAMSGFAFEGQVEFTNQCILRHISLGGVRECLPGDSSIGSAQLSALIALGLQDGISRSDPSYFEVARKLAPKNPLVSYYLGFLYLASNKVHQAYLAYSVAAEYGSGDIQSLAASNSVWLQGRLKVLAGSRAHR